MGIGHIWGNLSWDTLAKLSPSDLLSLAVIGLVAIWLFGVVVFAVYMFIEALKDELTYREGTTSHAAVDLPTVDRPSLAFRLGKLTGKLVSLTRH